MDEHAWAERYHAGCPEAVWRLWKKALRIVYRGARTPQQRAARTREALRQDIPRAVLQRYARERKARAAAGRKR